MSFITNHVLSFSYANTFDLSIKKRQSLLIQIQNFIMKKILFTALTAVSVFSGVFAKDKNVVSDKVITAFENEFQKATNVSWVSAPTFTQASFTLDGKEMNAFYDIFNEMIGTSQKASFENLSERAKQKIAKKYSDYTITEVITFKCEEGNCYYVSAQNGLQKLILKVVNDMVVVFQKSNKN